MLRIFPKIKPIHQLLSGGEAGGGKKKEKDKLKSASRENVTNAILNVNNIPLIYLYHLIQKCFI